MADEVWALGAGPGTEGRRRLAVVRAGGTISGWQTPVGSGFVSTVVISHTLLGQFDMIGKASEVTVKTKNTTDAFDLAGLAAALPSLIDCGKTAAQ